MAFHDRPFDQATLLKIDIFRGYIREWLPVFLSSGVREEVGIFDLFCGPGADVNGQEGSPLAILGELNNYLESANLPRARNLEIGLHFNDANGRHVAALQDHPKVRNDSSRCEVTFSASDFEEALGEHLPFMRRKDTAALVFLDQCGVRQVSESILKELIQCPTTDVLFFISSDYVRRFSDTLEIQRYFPKLSGAEIKSLPHSVVHRYLCKNYYRSLVPNGVSYYLAPFSIKKDVSPNVYGVIFGSGNLLGLEKFLKVCWEKDKVTGEANFNIDEDYNWDGERFAFPDFASPRKHEQFETSLLEYVAGTTRTNHEVYRFTLEAGFLPKHASRFLKKLQDQGRLFVQECETGKVARKGSFYLSWDKYDKEKPRVRFILKEGRSCGRVE